jgi:LPXTG-motif cell wall-anchored protein
LEEYIMSSSLTLKKRFAVALLAAGSATAAGGLGMILNARNNELNAQIEVHATAKRASSLAHEYLHGCVYGAPRVDVTPESCGKSLAAGARADIAWDKASRHRDAIVQANAATEKTSNDLLIAGLGIAGAGAALLAMKKKKPAPTAL